MFNVLVEILKPFLVKFKISLITYMGTLKFFSISFGVAVTMYPCQNYHFTFWFLKIYYFPFTIYFWQYIIFYFSRFSELWGMKCNCNNNGNLTPLSSVMWKTKAISILWQHEEYTCVQLWRKMWQFWPGDEILLSLKLNLHQS